jgi:hypothetical protein
MITRAAFTVVLGLLLAVGPATAAPGDEESRTSTTKHYVTGGREGSEPTAVSRDRYDGLNREGLRENPGKSQGGDGKPSGEVMAQSVTHDFWIFYADVVLFGDDDGDGYFYGIDLLFDADTIYEFADVYAVLYLSFEGGPWNEYAVTQDFRIRGATSDDEFVVVSELESGYPRGSYDILIELYDAIDGAFLASLGPEDTSELSLLRLEDFGRDDPARHHDDHGGGAAGLPLVGLLALTLAAGRRRSHRAAPPATTGRVTDRLQERASRATNIAGCHACPSRSEHRSRPTTPRRPEPEWRQSSGPHFS